MTLLILLLCLAIIRKITQWFDQLKILQMIELISLNQSYTSWNQLCKTIVILNLSAREKTHLNVAVSKKKVQMI